MIDMKRYTRGRSLRYRIAFNLGRLTSMACHRWMAQPTWARTMVYIVTGYAIGYSWSAWVS